MSDPLRAIEDTSSNEAGDQWTGWLIVYVRVMAGIAMLKGLYHWARVCGIGDGANSTFELSPVAWQAATIFFAVIDLVAAVGLWLAAAWGGVVWLTAAISMAAVELLFPSIFGGHILVVLAEFIAVGAYLTLAVMASRGRTE
jgi:hypothetical protein